VVFKTTLEGIKGTDDGKKGGENAANYSAAYTTRLRDLQGSEFVGEIGVGTRPLPKECNAVKRRNISLAEITASGHAKASLSKACRVREQSTLKVVFDTGSTNIWMASDLCEGVCARKGRHRYNHTVSTTYVKPAHSSVLDIQFGTASLKGPRGIDNFHVGPFTIKHQAFNLIAREDGFSFEKLPLEGIVGLAFPSMSASGELPFFDNVIHQKLLEHNEFAFYVDDHGGDSSGGAVLWGGVDPDLYEGPIVLFPVSQAHYWALDLHEFRVGSERLHIGGGDYDVHSSSKVPSHNVLLAEPHFAPLSPQRRSTVRKIAKNATDRKVTSAVSASAARRIPKLVVDSGTTYVTADPLLRAEIATRLPDGRCDDTAKYPHLVFTLKDVAGNFHDLDLSPREYMASADEGQTCELSVMELTIPEKYGPGMVVGELFMRRYFTVFDRGSGAPDDARIGFARARSTRM
jgi:pepsin A